MCVRVQPSSAASSAQPGGPSLRQTNRNRLFFSSNPPSSTTTWADLVRTHYQVSLPSFRFPMPSAPYPPSDVLARTLVQRRVAFSATPALRRGRHRQRTRRSVSFRIRASGTRSVLESRGDAADQADVASASRASFCAQGIRRGLRSTTRRCRKWASVAVSLVRRRESRFFDPTLPLACSGMCMDGVHSDRLRKPMRVQLRAIQYPKEGMMRTLRRARAHAL